MLIILSLFDACVGGVLLFPPMGLMGSCWSAALLTHNIFFCSISYDSLGVESPTVELQSILTFILLWYSITQPEDIVEESLERFILDVGVLPLTSKLKAGNCPVELSIPVWFTKNTVGKVESESCWEYVFVEEMKKLFPKSLTGTTIQDGGTRERGLRWLSNDNEHSKVITYISELQRVDFVLFYFLFLNLELGFSMTCHGHNII